MQLAVVSVLFFFSKAYGTRNVDKKYGDKFASSGALHSNSANHSDRQLADPAKTIAELEKLARAYRTTIDRRAQLRADYQEHIAQVRAARQSHPYSFAGSQELKKLQSVALKQFNSLAAFGRLCQVHGVPDNQKAAVKHYKDFMECVRLRDTKDCAETLVQALDGSSLREMGPEVVMHAMTTGAVTTDQRANARDFKTGQEGSTSSESLRGTGNKKASKPIQPLLPAPPNSKRFRSFP